MTAPKSPTARRNFLLTTLGVVSAGAAGAVGYAEWQRRRTGKPGSVDRPGIINPQDLITQRRRLGRTGLQISVIGIGGGQIEAPELIARAVDKGMNYLDTSICYGDSEKIIRKALLGKSGLRQKLVIATKWDCEVDWKAEQFADSLDRSLDRLGVDHVDIMQVHWLGGGHVRPDDGFNRLDNPALLAAMQDAKKSGKVSFFGATSHDANRSKILMRAIESGAFDMVLVKMNVLDFEKAGIPALLSKAKERDIGVVAMKSQPSGGELPPGYETSKYSVYQANLRWVLSQEAVTSVVHTKVAQSAEWQDAAASAVQASFAQHDADLLGPYAEALSPRYCRGCGECASACPAGVAVPHVLHFEMYDRVYGWHDRAKGHYRSLPLAERWSDVCTTCSACSDACPFGVDAAGRVRAAKALG